jgi:uncharacterized membrane protein (UPF0127 family)
MESGWQLCERKTSRVVVPNLRLAVTFWSRLIGLQFRKSLPSGSGLLLAPCNSVHTFFLRFPIDVVAVDRIGCVLQVCRGLKPWRLVLPIRGARAIVELPAGDVSVAVGDTLSIKSPATEVTPAPASIKGLVEAN